MFEGSLITFLAADSALVALLSPFGTPAGPAIFSSAAPQRAVLPYIVFDIDVNAVENLAASGFDVIIDIYDRQESGKNLRDIAERIEIVCDREIIYNDDRYGQIRLFWEDSREVENSDVKIRHRVCRLSARAGRKKWAAETT